MEKTTDTANELHDPQYIKNKMMDLLIDYINDPLNEIDGTMTNAPQSQFESFLSECQKALFFEGVPIDPQTREVDYIFLYYVCDIYLTLCDKYNKIPSAYGFEKLTGINHYSVTNWGRLKCDNNIIDIIHSNNINIVLNDLTSNRGIYSRRDVLTSLRWEISQKLLGHREAGLKNKLVSSGHPVGVITVGNNEYNWSADIKAQETRAQALTLSELPKIGGFSSNCTNENTPQLDVESL